MSHISLTRFHADPADAEQVRAPHAALVSAIRATLPEPWVGVWRWDCAASLQAARQAAPGTAAATAAFAVAREVTAEDIEVLDEL
ncbi:hypothetical protein [Nonomuraea basaltis]|uniref:hypothetical protein n=1 Tax=Nonomuraea basaltis TaxID=2495887 RepID=UPI00110C6745|nr:hypothetical protein [Nonomuraea basaltis]TMR90444.1 hypothetical protein EJK15_55340 [Nonomuraea basaltis]